MRRRDLFLQWMSTAGIVGGLTPRLVFAGSEPAGDTNSVGGAERLAKALAEAKRRGKPVLVLAEPCDADPDWDRGDELGFWLAGADETLLADLALFDVVCATIDALFECGVVGIVAAARAPMYVVETHASDPTATAIDGVLGAELIENLNWYGRHGEETSAEFDARMTRAIKGRNAEMTKWLRATVKVDERLALLAARVEATLTATEVEALDDGVAMRRPLSSAEVLRSAAVLRYRASQDAEIPADTIQRACAFAAAAVLTTTAPAGAVWAKHADCGRYSYDDPNAPDEAPPAEICGTGYIPIEGRRFLHFLTKQAE